ncbi:Lipopolysaccharide export system ATP-binding protein LptB [Baekduia alba]|nr:Lipopolysaccharide export system ATP-binding protein LptB [Baekduia alba]
MERESTVGLVGPNGAGKTTAFNLITGFLASDQGRVVLRGQDITGWAAHRIVQAGMSRTFQNLRLFDGLGVLGNVLSAVPRESGENPLVALAAPWIPRRQERRNTEQALHWLDYVGLAHRRGDLAGDLSYGQRKRVCLARLLATDAEVLLLDEPSSGVDPGALPGLIELVASLPALGKTVVVVEHNLEVVEALCQRLLFLDRGRLLADGEPAELFARTDLSDLYFGQTPTPSGVQ